MSSLRSVLESNPMSDNYTCSVCGMKIPLHALTDHVLVHDQYSAFSYNETTKIIEPLDEDQEQHFQNETTSNTSPAKPFSFSYVPEVSYESAHTPQVVTEDMAEFNQNNSNKGITNTSQRSTLLSKSYSIVPHLQKKIAEAPLEHLTGIQMIASVAESLGKREVAEADVERTYGWADESGIMNINRPLKQGDIIGTINLPFIQSGTMGTSCECSIVFNRFVNECETSAPEIEEATECVGMTLEDIIEDEEEDFGEDYAFQDVPLEKRRKYYRNPLLKGGKPGRKMEVYKYREPVVDNDVQIELQKSIVPELLNDPAVVKYLETITGKTVEEVVDDSDSQSIEEAKNGTEQVRNCNDSELNDFKNFVKDCTSNNAIGEKKHTEAAKEDCEEYLTKEVTKKTAVNSKTRNDIEDSVNDNTSEQKRNTIAVKWEQKAARHGEAGHEHDKESNQNIPALDNAVEHHSAVSVSDDADEVESENDDSEQEMMDIESNIHEDNSSDEAIIDTISEKQLSLFSFKVEQFVEDITNEVKQKFCDEINIQKDENQFRSIFTKTGDDRQEEDGLDDETDAADLKSEIKLSLANKNLTFCCSVCQKTVNSLTDLRKHFLTHQKDDTDLLETYRIVDKNVNMEADSKSQTNSQSKVLFYCMICDILLPSQKELKDHRKTHKEKGGRSKDIIVKPDGTSASEDTLTADSDVEDISKYRNRFEKHLKKPKALRKGSKRIKIEPSEGGLEVKPTREKTFDMNRKKTIRSDYICEYCGTGFFELSECQAHMEQCEDAGHLKCFQGCGYIFETKSQLEVHKRFCSRRLAYLDRINREKMKIENPDLADDFKFEAADDKVNTSSSCPFCGQKYKTEEKMTYHKLVCRLRPKKKCSQCDFECKGEKAMGKHQVEKHNLKPFKCEHCPRTFRLKGSMKDHVRYAHTRETFTCEYCGKSFIKQSMYRSHVSIQHEGFRLECSYCGKKFKDKRTWLVHEKSHKGAYEYACAMCKKTFNRSELYKWHMKGWHSIEGKAALSLNNAAKKLREELCSHVCNICKEKFPLEKAYHVHMMKVHNQDHVAVPLEN